MSPTQLEAELLKLDEEDRAHLLAKVLVASRQQSKDKPSERVRDLLGSLKSGIPDLAERHREYLLEAVKNGR